MSVALLGIGYVVAGAALALAFVIARRAPLALVDGALLVVLWPLYAPMLYFAAPGADRAADAREAELLAALARAADSPLASVLPDAHGARALARRLREATARAAELEVLLARPELEVARAEARVRELHARGSGHAAATAQLRVRTLGHLHGLRARYRAELDEVGELVAQLVAQAELLRLDLHGSTATVLAGDLVRELVARLEGLAGLEDVMEYRDDLARLPA